MRGEEREERRREERNERRGVGKRGEERRGNGREERKGEKEGMDSWRRGELDWQLGLRSIKPLHDYHAGTQRHTYQHMSPKKS